jgi:hypothetical protein
MNHEYLKLKDYVPHISGKTQIIENKGLPDEHNIKSNAYIIYEIDMNICNINDRHQALIKEMFS